MPIVGMQGSQCFNLMARSNLAFLGHLLLLLLISNPPPTPPSLSLSVACHAPGTLLNRCRLPKTKEKLGLPRNFPPPWPAAHCRHDVSASVFVHVYTAFTYVCVCVCVRFLIFRNTHLLREPQDAPHHQDTPRDLGQIGTQYEADTKVGAVARREHRGPVQLSVQGWISRRSLRTDLRVAVNCTKWFSSVGGS